MKIQLVTTAVFALALLGPAARAQSLVVTDSNRTLEASAFGFDYEYDDGLLLNDAAPGPTGAWSSALDADLVDYWSYDVARGRAAEDSLIAADKISFQLDASATTAGNHFSADASGSAACEVSFTLPRKVRYQVDLSAQITYGYNDATVILSRSSGPVFGIQVYQVGQDSLQQVGWLDAGDYDLAGGLHVSAYGTHDSPDAQSGQASCAFRIFHAADFDLNGRLELVDIFAFSTALIAGGDEADFDGDGDADSADFVGFMRAWKQGTRFISHP